MKKKLTKSNDKIIDGVCGGIAEYHNNNPTIIRLFTAMFAIFTGIIFVAVLYFIVSTIMPEKEN